MSKLMSLEKQLENLAKKDYINKQIDRTHPKTMQEMVQSRLKEKFEINKEEIIKEYLKTHPKIKKQYEEKTKTIKRIKIGLALGGAVAVLGMAGIYTLSQTKGNTQVGIEQQNSNLNDKSQENSIEYKILSEINNLEKEDDIVDYTKGIIVESYNKNNTEERISIEDLEMEISNLYLIERTDKLGNVVGYERALRELKEGEKVVNKTQYIYSIKGERVANYYIEEDGKTIGEVIDKTIKDRKDFSKYIQIVKKDQDLTKIYKYPSNEIDKDKAKEEYVKVAIDLMEDKETQVVKAENIR